MADTSAPPRRTLASEARRVPLWWAASHTLAVVASVLYLISLLFGASDVAAFFYRAAVSGSFTGNLLAIYSHFGWPKPTQEYLLQVYKDEPLQHAILALRFFFVAPSIVLLLPLYFASMHRSANYLVEKFLPLAAPSLAQQYGPLLRPLANQKQQILQRVALLELFCIAYLVLTITSAGHLMTLLVLVQILLHRMRLGSALGPQYKGDLYKHTRNALGQVQRFCDNLAHHPQCPSVVRTVYERVRDAIILLGAPPAPAPAPGPAAPEGAPQPR